MKMTSERKKAILFLSLTLVAGILIGMLIPGLVGRFHHRKPRNGDQSMGHDKREWLMHTVFRVIHPDSIQAGKIRPIVQQASDKIQAIGRRGDGELVSIMDSLKLQLQPMLTAAQNERLKEFGDKARGHRKVH